MKIVNMLISILLLTSFDLRSQDGLRSQLFSGVEDLMSKAKAQNGEFFAPKSFKKGLEYYSEASDLLKRGKGLEDIRESIKNSEAYFAKVLDLCKVGDVSFSSVKAARTDADSAGARKHAPELWESGERYFKTAGEELEGGSLADAKEEGRKAEENYRAAELEAIKSNYLSPARELLKKADEMDVEKNAKITLQNAWRLARQVESMLKDNRYDTDEARQIAQEAKIEASHALYLDRKIEELKTTDKTFEEVLLNSESEIRKIAVTLGINIRFDDGLAGAVDAILNELNRREAKEEANQESIRLSKEAIRQKEAEVENLKKQIGLMSERLGTLSDAEKKLQEEGRELQRKLALKHEHEESVKSLSAMFTEEEAYIVREGDNIIIRMYGLVFGTGKSSIDEQYYPLLAKVQQGIRRFPNSQVIVEGHTDSQGGDDANQLLSEKRATAIAEYLMANMSVNPAIMSYGYGESRPIASNDTQEGRSKNRRIDIVIVPQVR